MFKSIGTTLITGLFTVLPIVLTLYLLYWLAITSEQVMGTALQWALPSIIYFPGMGTIAGLILVFMIGLLMKAVLIRQLFNFSEEILYRLPIIKSIYRAIRDLLDFFSPRKEHFGRVVTVTINDMQAIGFITQDDPARLPESLQDEESVLVYIPMSYMIGGFTLMVSRQNIKPCKMNMDEAMRFVLTAGIAARQAAAGSGKAR